jgi:hypothetical protein
MNADLRRSAFTGGQTLREKSNLLVQGHEIKVIPGFDNLSIVNPDDCHSVKVDWRLSGSFP